MPAPTPMATTTYRPTAMSATEKKLFMATGEANDSLVSEEAAPPLVPPLPVPAVAVAATALAASALLRAAEQVGSALALPLGAAAPLKLQA